MNVGLLRFARCG